MAQQQQQFIIGEFIEKVKKKRLARNNPYIYDHTTPISSNRGNKLNRNAKFVHEGKLNNSILFKEQIEHAGYRRNIISVNPPYYTPDGDVIEDESDVDDDDEPLEENIYKDIRLEEILAPLTTASDLPAHPSLSLPYKEKGLPELIRNAEDMLHREQQVLWKMKRLFTEMRGDLGWAPVGAFHTSFDDRMLGTHRASTSSAAVSADVPSVAHFEESSTAGVEVEPMQQAENVEGTQQEDVQMADEAAASIEPITNGASMTEGIQESHDEPRDIEITDHAAAVPSTNGTTHNEIVEQPATNGTATMAEDVTMTDPATVETIEEGAEPTETVIDGNTSVGDADSVITPAHRMTTRAQANQSTRTPSLARSMSPGSSVPIIHPFFQFPSTALGDKNLGLPAQMADEARVALTAYISKQEEIVRSVQDIHSGLLKAMEMRTNVWNWTKAEGHVGDMSDNEDWVDLEAWGIDPRDTKIKYSKGQQEDEQEAEEEERRKRMPRRVARAAKE